MFYQVSTVLAILIYLVGILQPLYGQTNVGVLITCLNKTVNLKYRPPLPSAGNEAVDESVEDSGIWKPCQVAGVDFNVQYYLSVVFSQANCQKATFTQLFFRGNLYVVGDLPKVLFNFTIDLSDPNHPRKLRETQIFYGNLSVPVIGYTTLPANLTFTFLPQSLTPKKCEEVKSGSALVDAYLYLAQIPASLAALLHG